MADKKVFIDSNVLVYANNSLSPFCHAARTKLEALAATPESLWVTRQVFREFAVIVTREMLSIGRVDFELLESTINRFGESFNVAEESQAVTTRWLQLLKETNTAGKQIHDANIVAAMLVHGIDSILTNNVSDFNRFSHLVNVLPLV